MRTFAKWLLFSSCIMASVACHDGGDDPGTDVGSAAHATIAAAGVEQISPPLGLETPPADAAKTASGMRYKTLVVNTAGARPKANETALVQYTGWIQRTGATFFTTRGRQNAIAIDLAHAAPAFAEALPLLHKGEKAVFWIPPSPDTPERVVYEIEVVDIVSPPALARQPRASDRAAPAAARP